MSEFVERKVSHLTRRRFLGVSTAATGLLITTACTSFRPAERKSTHLEFVDGTAVDQIPIKFGKEEAGEVYMDYSPDTHISFIKSGSTLTSFVSAGIKSYRFESADPNELFDGSKPPTNCLFPTGEEDYAALGSVLKISDQQLLGFYHIERWVNKQTHFPFVASIGRALSTDGGKSWAKTVDVLEGNNPEVHSSKVRGAGQPCAIVKDGNILLYYTDWNGKYADSIHLARSPLNTLGDKGSWEKFNGTEFGTKAESAPVITPPKDTSYTALASISYNNVLQKYLAIFETNVGFYAAQSNDGIGWDSYQQIAKFPQKHSERKNGDTWYSYPSLLSLTENNDGITSNSGFLYYSKGVRGNGSHTMYRVPFTINS